MKFILDLSKWRCGGNATPIDKAHDEYTLGKGEVALLNKEGYMCCLGQFCSQANEQSIPFLLGLGEPSELQILVDGLNKFISSHYDGDTYYNTAVCAPAIEINDNPSTTIRQKIDALIVLFQEHGHEIEIINPTNIQY